MALCPRDTKRYIAVGAISSLLTAAIIFGVLISMNPGMFKLNMVPPDYAPQIDGVMTSQDHWEQANWIHAEYFVPYNLSLLWDLVQQQNVTSLGEFLQYLLLNMSVGNDYFQQIGYTYNGTNTPGGNQIAYNWYYIHNTTTDLYICADLCSVTQTNANWSWVWLAIDTDGSQNVVAPFIWQNPSTLNVEQNPAVWNNGLEWLFLNLTTGNEVRNLAMLGEPSLDSFLNATITDAQVSCGFNTSVNSAVPHRIIEMRIPLIDLGYYKNGSTYPLNLNKFGVQMWGGEGSAPLGGILSGTMPLYYIWMAPTLSLPFIESGFFLCGASVPQYSFLSAGT